MTMESLTSLWGNIVHQFNLHQPFIPGHLFFIFGTIFPITIGAHASLIRPTSAAKPTKPQKGVDDDSDDEDHEEDTEQKLGGFGPIDALVLPLMCTCSLLGFYYLFKWVKDPVLVNKILSLYFSPTEAFAVGRLLSGAMEMATSFIFPSAYTAAGKVWRADQSRRKMISLEFPPLENPSPLPGWFSTLKIPQGLIERLWSIRNMLSAKFRVRIYISAIISANFRASALDLIGLVLAIVIEVCYLFFGKPWELRNLVGISLAYMVIQIASLSTFWTGTLVLSALLIYDIYFVFYSPVMQTVAIKNDVSGMLLFPHASRTGFAMVGLGDIVLPGFMISLALRFDLYLFYLRKQFQRHTAPGNLSEHKGDASNIVKADWLPATGNWGECFWIGRKTGVLALKEQAGIFPKTYFYASVLGYLAGMITTQGIMVSFKKAQPALLYLVPGVLGALWGTALLKGDFRLMWEYNEATNENSTRNLIWSVHDKTRALDDANAVIKDDPETSKKEGNSDNLISKGHICGRRQDEVIHISVRLLGARDRSVDQERISNEEGPKTSGGDAKPAFQPIFKDVPRLLSADDTGSWSTSLGLHTAEQDQEPSGKRQRLV